MTVTECADTAWITCWRVNMCHRDSVMGGNIDIVWIGLEDADVQTRQAITVQPSPD